MTPGDLNFDLSKKMTEMVIRELVNAAFRFYLRRPGAEIMGGVQTPPPPPAAGGVKSRGPAGRGLRQDSHSRNPDRKPSDIKKSQR